ncbi:MAG TPA: hexitol phosphatase HxpB [Candidatus Saccharimonadales bacterium]|nr:hexitol phosphatase HxpB [Candidatus Saccharimonadales bacterium]
MIQAVIFDMDGLLIDSEPLWVKIELEVFGALGVPLTTAMSQQTMGLRADEVVRYWHHRYPWDKPSQKEVAELILEKMIEQVRNADIALPGVDHAFAIIQEAGLPIAIASSSPTKMIEAVTKNLAIQGNIKLIKSAEHEKYGKPHPDIYIHTAEGLGIAPEHCLAFEDSINGVIAAKAAKMRCIAIPAPDFRANKAYGITDDVLDSLEELTAAHLAMY